MTIQVVLKETRQIEPFANTAQRMFRANAGIKVVGTITNGNTQEILGRDSNPIFHIGSRFELDQLRKRYRRDSSRIFDIAELDPTGRTLVDIDSMGQMSARFGARVIQHWSEEAGSRIYFEKPDHDVARVDKGSLIAPYLVLSELLGLFERAQVNIVKNGPKPNPESKTDLEQKLQKALGTTGVSVSNYTNGVRYYDILITLFSKAPISQRDIAEILERAPRMLVDINDVGMHDTLKIHAEAARKGRLRPPIIACLTREGKSTIQEIRLSTDPAAVVAAANVDAVRILAGNSIEDAMNATDYSLGLKTN